LHRLSGALLLSLTLFLLSPPPISAQSPIGVVTAIRGTAQLTGPRLPTPTALHFKDNLFVRDIVDTQKDSVVRTLLGGKFTVTVRELTRFELREETLPTGATRSTFDLATGKIRVSIARRLLSPGSEVLIRTPNAVAAVRGTTIIAECIPERVHAISCMDSIFSVVSGEALITPVGLAPFVLAFNNTVTTTGTEATGIHVGSVKEMTSADVGKAQAGLNAGPPHTAEDAHAQVETAADMARTIPQPPAILTPPTPATSSVGAVTTTSFPSTKQVPAVVVATPPPSSPPSPSPPPPPRPPR
jgi:hypothetical protein